MNDIIVFTNHAREMLKERNIQEEYVLRAIRDYDRFEIGEDGNAHYLKSIVENDGRMIHIVVNKNVNPNRIVTLFYDRKAGRKI